MRRNYNKLLKSIREVATLDSEFYRKHPDVQARCIELLLALPFAEKAVIYEEQDSVQIYFEPSKNKKKAAETTPRINVYIFPNSLVSLNIHRLFKEDNGYDNLPFEAAAGILRPELELFYS